MAIGSYEITGSSGVVYGEYSGYGPRDALDKLAIDAGYKSYRAWCRDAGVKESDWTTDPSAFRRGGVALLVREIEST